MAPMPELYIGLMSGTSMDGVDGVLLSLSATGLQALRACTAPLAPALRADLLALNTSGPNELHRAALAGSALVRVYASVVHELLKSAQLSPDAIVAIGAHGQTVRHQPGLHDDHGYTLQLNQPALLAELTGIDVVADFRSRDVAAGGQGAPLVPAFHQWLLSNSHPSQDQALLNLGGISNLSLIPAQPTSAPVLGFDCGPGNVLLDAWCERHRHVTIDWNGAWAAQGQIQSPLLQDLLADPYFLSPPPKSTGRDLFNLDWLDRHLRHHPGLRPEDVQATLVELTLTPCVMDLFSYQKNSKNLWVCGGGAKNSYLMQRLRAQMHTRLPGTAVQTTDDLGLPVDQMEAAAFAWLARQTVMRRPGNLPSVTGARGARVLGCIYPR